jgi:hypothetical protein
MAREKISGRGGQYLDSQWLPQKQTPIILRDPCADKNPGIGNNQPFPSQFWE